MMFLSILAVATLVAAAIGRRSSWQTHLRRGLAVAMIMAGIAHLTQPAPFLAHLPEWVPARDLIIAATGVIEIILGAALFGPSRHRGPVGRLLVAYLVVVVPANVYVAIANVAVEGQPGGLYAWLRLPVQALLVWIALWSTRHTAIEPANPSVPNHSASSPAAAVHGER
jgi:uncharacterized membrane protein